VQRQVMVCVGAAGDANACESLVCWWGAPREE
jgi:hypothetical protein